MSLLRRIQSDVVGGEARLGPIMLKVRLLAARLGSAELGDWVKHESEGYPDDVEVPEYRSVGISYTAHFSGPFGAGISNAPIPPALVAKFAGEEWNTFELRQGIAAIDDLVASARAERGVLNLNCANLILLLQGNVYSNYACNSVTGTISAASLSDVQHAVRSRILELVLELENSVPQALSVEMDGGAEEDLKESKDKVTQIYQNIIHGNAGSVSGFNSGVLSSGSQNVINFSAGDSKDLKRFLTANGISGEVAEELTEIIELDGPGTTVEPLGKRAKEWLSKNIAKAADGSWNIGVAVLTNVLTEAAKRYYGLT
ncbi:MAG: hypothetical protein VX529_07615 [Pseudomonadota bacterium]|nr:hypothetical protein [Pseudomonadota bacterium]